MGRKYMMDYLYEKIVNREEKIKSISVCKIPRLDELSVLG